MHFEGNPIGPFVGLLLLAAVAIWFALLSKLFKHLLLHHVETYRQLGEPTLFPQTNIGTVFATAKFLVARQHRNLHDPFLSKLADFMLVFLVALLTLFVLVVLFMDQLQWRMYAA